MSSWYAIIDCAADARLHNTVRSASEKACLYSGDYEQDVESVLPFLVRMKEGEEIASVWQKHESGRFWGILIRSSLGLKDLRRHLRKFTTAKLPLGDVVLFRFWDPRVFSTFAEEGTQEEVAPFFSKVDAIIADFGAQGRRRYRWNDKIIVEGRSQPAGS